MSDLRCPTCGATLTPLDMAKPSCSYCGTVLPHHARAAEQAALVNQMMADRGASGMPRVFEGLLANAPQGQPHLIGVNVPPSTQVTPFGGPPGGPFVGPPGVPMVYAQLHTQGMQAANSARNAVLLIVIAVVVIVLMMGAGAAMFVLQGGP